MYRQEISKYYKLNVPLHSYISTYEILITHQISHGGVWCSARHT